MTNDTSVWLPPIIVAAGVGLMGWLLRQTFTGIVNRIESLESAFTRVTAELAAAHRALEKRLDIMDRRVTRLESWRDMIELPSHVGGRRMLDRFGRQQMSDEEDERRDYET